MSSGWKEGQKAPLGEGEGKQPGSAKGEHNAGGEHRVVPPHGREC